MTSIPPPKVLVVGSKDFQVRIKKSLVGLSDTAATLSCIDAQHLSSDANIEPPLCVLFELGAVDYDQLRDFSSEQVPLVIGLSESQLTEDISLPSNRFFCCFPIDICKAGWLEEMLLQANTTQKLMSQNTNIRRQLVEFEDHWWTAANSLPQLVCLLNDELGVLLTNRTAQDWGMGVLQDTMGKKIHELLHRGDPEEQEKLGRLLSRACAGDLSAKPFTFIFYDAALSRHIEIRLHRSQQQQMGNKLTVAIAEDITEHMQAEEALRESEEQLRQSQKMEAVGRLAGGVAHDFNNLLTVILANAQLAQMDVPEDHSAQASMREILQGAQRGAELTQQLLAFARKQVLEPKTIDINELLHEIHSMLKRLLTESIQLEYRLEDKLPVIKIDPTQLQQILMNLVVNAGDAILESGIVTIETRTVTINTKEDQEPSKYVELQITDTGSGMDPDTIERIFEPFYTTKEQGKGTGLGLATVYGIVKQLRGDIRVFSEPGLGTTFTLLFPTTEDEEPTVSLAPVPTQNSLRLGYGEMILVVEDDPSIRNLIKQILTRARYNVFTASDAREAWMIVERYAHEIDLILTDVMMPEMNGRELAERIWEALPDMRILFVSGYTDAFFEDTADWDTDIHFLGKPFTPDTLLNRLHSLLDSDERVEKQPPVGAPIGS